jgi:2-oxoglutarate ferredoxin oxidoreductase subunit delta
MSADYNSKGYHTPEAVAPDKCTGCDLCGLYCPDFAIHGWRI